MRKRATVIVISALIVLALGAGAAQADIYMKQKRHTDSFKVMGKTQPEKTEVVTIWIGDNKARSDMGEEQSVILLADKKIIVMLNHAKMTYSEMPMDLDKIMEEAVGDDEEAQKAMKFMKGLASSMMTFEVKVTETGERMKIKNWDCRKYLIDMKMGSMGHTVSEAWATEDLKVDFRLYFPMANAMMSGQPGFQQMIKEMEKIKGVTVLSKSTGKVMGADVTTTEELEEFAQQDAPAGTYDIPQGYKKVKAMKR